MWFTVTKNSAQQPLSTFNSKTEETDSMFWLFQNQQKSDFVHLRI